MYLLKLDKNTIKVNSRAFKKIWVKFNLINTNNQIKICYFFSIFSIRKRVLNYLIKTHILYMEYCELLAFNMIQVLFK